jgi:hypothetical protein
VASDRRIIPSFPRYTVDNLGVVRNGERIMWVGTSIGGYRSANLTIAPGVRKKALIHRLVCEAFHGPAIEPNTYVRHLNGYSSDNDPSNLSWGTHKQNMLDRDAHGTTARGERQGTAKLTATDVVRLRLSVSSGMTTKDAALYYGISQGQASHIATGRTWKTVGGPISRRRGTKNEPEL